jgi:hypothetical protein
VRQLYPVRPIVFRLAFRLTSRLIVVFGKDAPAPWITGLVEFFYFPETWIISHIQIRNAAARRNAMLQIRHNTQKGSDARQSTGDECSEN